MSSYYHFGQVANNEPGYKSALCGLQSLLLAPLDMLEQNTSPEFSYFTIRSHHQQKLHLCDKLIVNIETRSENDDHKTYGGDYFWAWVYNTELGASAAADDIIDHQNGSYTATFQLHWAMKTSVAVILVHSSEAVTVLKRLRDNHPARSVYAGKFRSDGNNAEITPCHITEHVFIDSVAMCNFTDHKTGFPWFCVKPDTLGCDMYAEHAVFEADHEARLEMMLSYEERLLFSP